MSESTQKCPSCSETVPLEYSVCPFCGFGLLEYELRKFSYKPKLKEVFIRLYNFFRRPFRTSEELGVATESKGTNILLLIFSLFLSLRFYMIIVASGLEFSEGIPIGNVTDPEAFGFTISFGLIFFLISFLVMPLIVWIIYKLLFSLGSWIMAKFAGMLGSDANTKQYRTIISYSIAPIVAGEFLGIFFALIAGFSSNFSPIGPTSGITYDIMALYLDSVYTSGMMVVFKILMIILWIIMIVYSTIGLRVVGKMAWVNASVSMVVPIGVFVYFFYFLNLFG